MLEAAYRSREKFSGGVFLVDAATTTPEEVLERRPARVSICPPRCCTAVRVALLTGSALRVGLSFSVATLHHRDVAVVSAAFRERAERRSRRYGR